MTGASEVALNACPACGGKAQLGKIGPSADSAVAGQFIAGCGPCSQRHYLKVPARPTKEEAIAAWNAMEFSPPSIHCPKCNEKFPVAEVKGKQALVCVNCETRDGRLVVDLDISNRML